MFIFNRLELVCDAVYLLNRFALYIPEKASIFYTIGSGDTDLREKALN